MQACAAGYALTYLITPKLQFVSGSVVGLTAAWHAWFLLVRYHVHLDLHGLELLFPVSYII
jgi:hypothetical protein